MTVNVNIVPGGAQASSGSVTTSSTQSVAVKANAGANSTPAQANVASSKPAEDKVKAASSNETTTTDTSTADEGRQDKVAALANLDNKEQPAKETPGMAKMAVTMIFKLAVVLALAYITILALKWMSSKKEITPSAKGELKIVDTVKLSPTSSLHVVDAHGKMLLLGSTAGQINVLCEIEKTELPEAIAQPEAESKFADYLAKYSGESNQNNIVGRLTGLLRDSTAQMQEKRKTAAGLGSMLSRDCSSQVRGKQRNAASASAKWLRNCAEYLEKKQSGSSIIGGRHDA